MGIIGLTTYISNHSERYLEDYALHDTYLVIDGNSLGCQLYVWYAKCNCVFGGDYDKYAKCISDFFDELLMCNVTPLVLIDGGCEDKKLKTIISRTAERIAIASDYTPSQHKRKFLPLFLIEVFKGVMYEKRIRYAQCIFEADNTIAAVARFLNCPVLSYDSDFYIYGSQYISLSTMEHNVVRNPAGNGYMKLCKIYYVEKLFQDYNGLNQSLLPLAGILLGNDYVNQRIFKNFFRNLKLPPTGQRKYNEKQRRINATFNWLRRHSLNQAVIEILSKLRQQDRKYVLKKIETIINGYINASLSISLLHILDVPVEKFSKTSLQNLSKTYKFEGDIYNLTYIEEKSNETDLSDDNDETEDKEITSILEAVEKEVVSNESLINHLPQWFINEFKLGRYPSYFIDIIVRKLYICSVQIEDYSHEPSVFTSLNIISIIYGLLISGIKGRKTSMEYMTRSENKKIKRYQLEYNNNILGCNLPSLSNLREQPIGIRREILNATLGIGGENSIKEIPSNWMLYIATIKYWINQQQEPLKLNCHIYSLLFALLFNIIDCKVGFYRILNKFQHRFSKTMEVIQYQRKLFGYQPQYSTNTTINDAFHEVNSDDCLIAAPFFISNFEMNQKLCQQPKKFNITIIHSFAEFQYCLKHIMDLNALLGYPYERTKIANVFNGTLLYNLCANFKRRDDVETYINLVLQNSPSLLHLFNILLSKVKPLFGNTLEKKANNCKKRRTKKYKEKYATQEEDHEEQTTGTCESTDEKVFHDVNNSFSILGII